MKIKIGTRKSKLALAQTELVKNKLLNAYPDMKIEVVYITTKGDRILDKSLAEIGGKGLFISEIEQALIEKKIDIAVHSAKDLPVDIDENLEISGVLKRGDYRDCLITRKGEIIGNSEKFIIGTGSLRRRMFCENLYSDVVFKDIRGNVDTRINKLMNKEYDGIILAMAGLERLEIQSDDKIQIKPFSTKIFLPAPCQAIIAVESRKNDEIYNYIREISDTDTLYAFETERHIIKKISGDCGIPLGVLSEIYDNNISIKLAMNSNKIITAEDTIENRFALAERLVEKI